MAKKPHSLEEIARNNRGAYCVPDGYFSELSNKLKENAEKPVQGGVWATFRSLISFAACFAVMVVLAMTGFYFTGHKAQVKEEAELHIANPPIQSQRETTTVDDLYVMSLYNITVEDIIEYGDTTVVSSQLFADAAIDYLDTYGYNLTDILLEE